MEYLPVGTFQAVVVKHSDKNSYPGDNIYIIDTRNGYQYHRSSVDGKLCRCNKIVVWENEGKREFMKEKKYGPPSIGGG